MNRYEKIITVNRADKDTYMHCIHLLLNFMFENCENPDFFRLQLKYSEKNPFAKDLLLEWCENKEFKEEVSDVK